MNEKQEKIEYFKLFAKSLAELGRPLQKDEIKKYQRLSREICELDRLEKSLPKFKQQLELVKMRLYVNELKQQHA